MRERQEGGRKGEKEEGGRKRDKKEGGRKRKRREGEREEGRERERVESLMWNTCNNFQKVREIAVLDY